MASFEYFAGIDTQLQITQTSFTSITRGLNHFENPPQTLLKLLAL